MSLLAINQNLAVSLSGAISIALWSFQVWAASVVFNDKLLPYPNKSVRYAMVLLFGVITAIVGFHISDFLGLAESYKKSSLALSYVHQWLLLGMSLFVASLVLFAVYAFAHANWLKNRKY